MNCSVVVTQIYIHTISCLLEGEEKMTDTHIHPYPPLSSLAKHTYISRSASITYTHDQLSRGDWGNDDRHTFIHPFPYPRLIACTNTPTSRDAFLFHYCGSVYLTRMQRYSQLAYLFHQCGTSLLNRDGLIADCALRYTDVERSFSIYFELPH